MEYLASFTDKEALVQERRQRTGATSGGLICAFSTLENCLSYDIYRDAQTHSIALRKLPSYRGRHTRGPRLLAANNATFQQLTNAA